MAERISPIEALLMSPQDRALPGYAEFSPHEIAALRLRRGVLANYQAPPPPGLTGQQVGDALRFDNVARTLGGALHLDDAVRGVDWFMKQIQGPGTAYADGGRPPVGQPAIVGERGPEVFVPDQPGTIVPNDEVAGLSPLQALMMAGTANVPQSPEMTRALPNYENISPFELAAMRQRETVRPTAGRAGEGPSIRDVFNMTPAGTITNGAMGLAQLAPIQGDLYGLAGQAGAATRQFFESGPTLGEILGVGSAEAADNESPEQVAERQKVYQAAGFYQGKIDGQDGPATKAAQRAYDAAGIEKKAAETAATNADTAKQNAINEARRLEQEGKKQEAKSVGNERLAQIEHDVPWYQQAFRDYSGPAGYVGGALLGLGARKLTAGGSNVLSKRLADRAEAMLAGEAGDIAGQASKVNEFWRMGGAKAKVPFVSTPQTDPGFAANPNVVGLENLYQQSPVKNAVSNVMAPAIFGADAAVGEFKLKPDAQERLQRALQAVREDPSEANIRELQAAKDNEAFADLISNAGRGGFLGNLTASKFIKQNPSRPNMQPAEAERLRIEEFLRREPVPSSPATAIPRQTGQSAESAPMTSRRQSDPRGSSPSAPYFNPASGRWHDPVTGDFVRQSGGSKKGVSPLDELLMPGSPLGR